MLYRLPEGSLTLEGTWQDRSVTMLVPSGMAAEGINLVVTRDLLPANMSLADHVARQRLTFRKELSGFTLLQDVAGAIDERPAHLLEFTWSSQDKPLYQAVVIAQNGDSLLNFTASIPGAAADAKTREALLQTISSFKFDTADKEPPEADRQGSLS